MPRFYYEFVELESTGDREFTYVVYDTKRGDQELARCERHDDAQKIVDALNRVKPMTAAESTGAYEQQRGTRGIFG